LKLTDNINEKIDSTRFNGF